MAKQILAALEIADPKDPDKTKWVSAHNGDRARGLSALRIVLFREPTDYEKAILRECLFDDRWGRVYRIEKLLAS